MKILLAACNAKYIHSNLAVYDLQAYASEYADHIILKEYTINQQKDDIMRDIYLEHPDVVCVSCYIWNLSFVKELMADLTKILPDADFWATWCGPCMRQGPVVEELAEEGYAVGKVDVDQNMALAQQFRVVSIPTLILFKDGAEVKRFVGLTSKEELKSALEG